MSDSVPWEKNKSLYFKIGIFPVEKGKFAVFPDINLMPEESYELNSLKGISYLNYSEDKNERFGIIHVIGIVCWVNIICINFMNILISSLFSLLVLSFCLFHYKNIRNTTGMPRVLDFKTAFPSVPPIDIRNVAELRALSEFVSSGRTARQYLMILLGHIVMYSYFGYFSFQYIDNNYEYESKIYILLNSLIIITVIIYEFAAKNIPVLMFRAKRGHWPTPDDVWAKLVK